MCVLCIFLSCLLAIKIQYRLLYVLLLYTCALFCFPCLRIVIIGMWGMCAWSFCLSADNAVCTRCMRVVSFLPVSVRITKCMYCLLIIMFVCALYAQLYARCTMRMCVFFRFRRWTSASWAGRSATCATLGLPKTRGPALAKGPEDHEVLVYCGAGSLFSRAYVNCSFTWGKTCLV